MKTKDLVLCALFSALICISTFFSFPIPFTAIPLTLQVLSVCVCGAILGPKRGTISVLIYVFMGFIGLPVFSGMKGGPSVIFGPTGGFILGFIAAAFVIGIISKKIITASDIPKTKIFKYFCSMLIGLLIIYSFGLFQYVLVTSANVAEAFTLVVLPFISVDLFKIALGSVLTATLYNHIKIVDQKI